MSGEKKVVFTSDNEKVSVKKFNKNIKSLNIQLIPKNNIENVVNPLEELVQCALCLDKLKHPKMLQCQHTFCLNCLQYYLLSGSNDIKCPTCKKYTPLENGLESLEHLPENFYIESILKLLANGSKTPLTPVAKGLDTKCIKCQNLCEFSQQTCKHCKQYFCKTCWSKHIGELKTNLNSLNEKLSECCNRLDHHAEIIKDHLIRIENNIRTTAEIEIKKIKYNESICLDEVNKLRENKIKTLLEFKTKIQECQHKFNDTEFNINNDSQKVIHFITMHNNTSSILNEVSQWRNERIIFNVDTFKIETETDITPDIIETEDDEPSTDVPVPVNIANSLENIDTLIIHYKTRRFSPKMTWTKCSRPAHIAVPPWNSNCIYIAGSDTRYIYGVDKQKCKLLFRISHSSMLCPTGITFANDKTYVSDKWKHCIHVFSKSGNYITSFGKKGTGNGCFKSPEGIAMYNNKLFICDTGNDRIQVLNEHDGSFSYSFGITRSERNITQTAIVMNFQYTEFNTPTGIAVADDKILIADNGNKRIKIYSLDGNKITEFGSMGKSKGQFRSPEVVAVDPLGFIFVGDSGNARVQIFRPNGTLVRVFGHKGNFSWVSGVCVTQQLDVIVSDHKTHSVHIF